MIAMICLGMTVLFALLAYFLAMPVLTLFGLVGLIGYVVFGLLSKPRSRRLSLRRAVIPYLISRIVIFVIVAAVMISTIVQLL